MSQSERKGLSPRNGILITLGLSLLATTVVRAAEKPDFSGKWQRNPALSQEWREKVEALTDPMAGRGGQPERRMFRSWLVRVLGEIGSVEIEQSPAELKLVLGEDRVRIFYLGREHLRQSPEGLNIKTASGWADEDFVIKQVTADGSTVTERLSMLGEGKQMAHLLRWEDERLTLPLIIRTVFDRAE